MNERVQRLRTESFDTPITISAERAELITDFYRENIGKYSVPMMRAKALEYLYQNQAVYIGEDELIVGERGP
ncbi:MAG: pyruvate formate lyase family protein, partial [Kiritimatiellia bacterium]|nr:pyruvate formate lyase family protein [Kiritimatiellia bacterium]